MTPSPGRHPGQFHVRASKGIHLVVPRDRAAVHTGSSCRRKERAVRHPLDVLIIGTTDTDWGLEKAHPAASSSDIDYLLEHGQTPSKLPLTREDVEGATRPAALLSASESTSKLSPSTCRHPVPGLSPSRRQVHDLPRDAATPSTRRRGLDARVPDSCRHGALIARMATGRFGNNAGRCQLRRRAPRPRRATCSTRTGLRP